MAETVIEKFGLLRYLPAALQDLRINGKIKNVLRCYRDLMHLVVLNKWIFIDVKVKGDEVNYFDYNEFSNVEKVGEGAFGSVNMADWKCCGIKIALKTLMNNQNNTDIINKFLKEVILKYKYRSIYVMLTEHVNVIT